MRVLLATPSYFPIVGGSEVLTRTLSMKLNETGIHADIMTFNMNKKWHPIWKEETIKNGPVRVFKEPALNPLPNSPNPMFNLFRMNVIPKPSSLNKLRDYDVIHFIGEADLSFPLLSHFVKRPKLLQCVAIFRNGGVYRYYMFDRVFLGRIFKKYFPRLADRFVAHSNRDVELLSDLGVPRGKILVLPIGVDTTVFRPNPAEKPDNSVLFVGRICRIKGLHILIRALSYLPVPAELAIIGPRADVAYMKEIEEMANAINKDGVHRVIFLGSMDQGDIVSWYQRASVVVCPYLYEDYSNVTRESLACGTPVLSTGAHLLENGQDGILLTEKNPKLMANAIKRLIEDREMRETYGKIGRELVERCFSWESVVRRLTCVYEDVVNA